MHQPLARIVATVGVVVLVLSQLAFPHAEGRIAPVELKGHPLSDGLSNLSLNDRVARQLVVSFNRDLVPEGVFGDAWIEDFESDHQLVMLRYRQHSDIYVFQAASPEIALNVLADSASRPQISSIAQNSIVESMSEPLQSDQWYLENFGQDFFVGDCPTGSGFLCDGYSEVRTQSGPTHDIRRGPISDGYDGQGVTVAVIDTGVATSHPDIADALVGTFNSYDGSSDVTDYDGHGTNVAGLIVARENNLGIAGVAPRSSLLLIKDGIDVPDPNDPSDIMLKITDDAAIDAIAAAQIMGADVINISQAGSKYLSLENAQIQDAIAAGVIIVAASGNHGDGSNLVSYPAAYSGVVSVGSVDWQGQISDFSTFNSYVDVAAPGEGIVTTFSTDRLIALEYTGYIDCPYTITDAQIIDVQGDTYCFSSATEYYSAGIQGTSFSAPIVAGAAVLAKQKWPRLTSPQFEMLVQQTADDAGSPGYDPYYGAGTLNLERLLSYNFPITIAQAGLSAPSVIVGGSTVATVLVDNMEGDSDVESVTVDLTPIGGTITQLSRTSEAFYSATINVPSSAQIGTHTLAVSARDIAGQVGSATLNLSVLAEGVNLPPINSITAPTNEVSVEITTPKRGKDVVTRKDSYSLRGTVGSGVAFLEMNGVPVALAPGDTSWSTDVELEKGDNDLEIVAYDVARTSSDRAEVTITLDTKAPGDVRNLKASGLKLTWESPKDKDVDGYRIYRKDGKKWKKVKAVTKEEFTVVAGGTYAVTAEDEAGNEADVDDAPTVSTGSPSTGSGGNLSPDRPVTRAEFSKLLAIAVNQEVGVNASFGDVPASHSLTRYIAAVSKKGWASGQGGNFFPDRPITRMEAARMLLRAMGWKVATEESFADLSGEEDRIATTLKSHGVMSGADGKFYPMRALTRREAESILAAAAGK